MADVTFDNVAKKYGEVSVIESLNLHIDDGELMVLVGPSGCGKSTALRMIAGLEDVTGGTISIGGRAVNALPPRDRDIAMVFQSYALYPHMSVRENLAFGLKMRRVAAAEIEKRVTSAAEILGISHVLERKPKELSGGQRQRVAVGRAIVRQPAVFLFDEPLSNLDAKLRVQTRGEITRLQQSLGTTSVYVTHDQVEAMTMGHRITVMRDGKIQQVGTPREVYERPANAFVAQFIGTPPMNLIHATVDGGSLRAPSFAIPLGVQLANGTRVLAGIRPEDITRGDAIHATVDVVEPVGHESIVYATAGSEKLVAIFEPREAPRAGETISLSVAPERVHLFDEAGVRVN
ncbi:MAG: sn-glycerol-3-phosphate ABC transporter ATP-binding protein UgpC [Acidobacteria bacterium]|nr:sn-glycerol-3-phosphate ABC transporter ATP-binding protein UgpC [Acidobacteriota bacterium]MBV9478245.1 sn-glycerol-3-phosphate ABC transporter ATP-binding protein UgpC [Acidobacteriota bacterium]